MESKRRNPILSRLACALAVTGAFVVPLAFYGAPALARSIATADRHGEHSSRCQYSGDTQYLSNAKYSRGRYSSACQYSSSAQYQYTAPPCGLALGRSHHRNGRFAKFGSHVVRGHHTFKASCSNRSGHAGHKGDDESGEGESGEGHSGGVSSQGATVTKKF